MFDHIQDKGLKTYLEDEESVASIETVASLLDYCESCLTEDENDEAVPVHKLEYRIHHYDMACRCFGRRDLRGVHSHLRAMWGPNS